MKSSGDKNGFRPFEGLKVLLENKSITLKKNVSAASKSIPDRTDPGEDSMIFEVSRLYSELWAPRHRTLSWNLLRIACGPGPLC